MENLCSILPLETCLLIAETDRVLCNAVKLLTVFFYWMHKMKTAASKILKLFVAGLYIGFWLRNAPLVKVIGNPVLTALPLA